MAASGRPGETSGEAICGLLNVAVLCVIAMVVMVRLVDMAAFAITPEGYPIGAQVAGLRYRSAGHYLSFGIGEVVLAAAAFAAGWVVRSRWVALAIRLSVATVLAAMIFVLWPPG
jgi:hypothetical protein